MEEPGYSTADVVLNLDENVAQTALFPVLWTTTDTAILRLSGASEMELASVPVVLTAKSPNAAGGSSLSVFTGEIGPDSIPGSARCAKLMRLVDSRLRSLGCSYAASVGATALAHQAKNKTAIVALDALGTRSYSQQAEDYPCASLSIYYVSTGTQGVAP